MTVYGLKTLDRFNYLKINSCSERLASIYKQKANSFELAFVYFTSWHVRKSIFQFTFTDKSVEHCGYGLFFPSIRATLPRYAKSPDFEQIKHDQIATPLNKEFPEITIEIKDVVEIRDVVKLFFGIFPHSGRIDLT